MVLEKYYHITNPKQAREALKEFFDSDTDAALTRKDMKVFRHLQTISYRDVPYLQHWIKTSSGPPAQGWTEWRWRQFKKELPKLSKRIAFPIFRGTYFPWIGGGHQQISKSNLESQINATFDSFDVFKPVTIKRIMSWTKSKQIAIQFAEQDKATGKNRPIKGGGYIHILQPPLYAVDVLTELLKTELISFNDGTNELSVAKREKEFLLLPGTILTPVKRKGRIFHWKVTKSI